MRRSRRFWPVPMPSHTISTSSAATISPIAGSSITAVVLLAGPAGLQAAGFALKEQSPSAQGNAFDRRDDGLARRLDRVADIRKLRERLLTANVDQPATRFGDGSYLVFNPLGVPRRVAVILPDAALDLRPEGPLRATQFTEEGVCAVVDLPAFGFACSVSVPAIASK